ncbi:uncharacterized protein K460DRAFT_386810 [Cucurbitaria berberidis CBS 394.84]|uniref:DNA polymerase delta subunit 4 n=1 Tax=Cucurbitaria berberidis CBS 394.84 TaxID=1168544 RepID=A0A9P4GI80_9PLEO|nr:uncharacterized protein K460DRAFT_386810 [Cucurbitaria berberidis CBS 394.84]KAF1846643.1 hypothetical protein K460DRAFT_386810 [Cucurbitaria berberidis CBS 394.84]
MPPKRRASGPATKAQQSTLAFHGVSNKVTKAGARAQSAKNILDDSNTKDPKPEIVEIEDSEPTTAEAAVVAPTERKIKAQRVESTPEEVKARRITDAAIRKYWAAKEKQRMAPRVHQQGLSLHEKVLREFDVSAHYGPCTGITRPKRWKRAHGLGLEPPMEVLAVLLKEQEGKDDATVQRSRVDELLNSKTDVEV